MSTEEDIWNLREAAWPLFWCASLIFTSLAIASFPSRLNRWNAVFILLIATCGAFQTGTRLAPDDTLNDIYLRFVIILASHIAWLSFQDVSPESGLSQDPESKAAAWLSGYRLLFNPRGVGTSSELPWLWRSQKYTTGLIKPLTKLDKEKNKLRTTSHSLASKGKWAAILIRLVHLLLGFVMICCYYEFFDPKFLLGINPTDYEPAKSSIMRRFIRQSFSTTPPTPPITKRELLVRIHEAATNFLPDYLILSSYHDFFAILFILTGLDQSWEWPPLFGSITQAYSMRRFWSMFWHRLIYRSFSSHAAVITSTLGMNQRTSVSRIVNNWLVFLFSALMHGVVFWQFGTKCAWSSSMWYWLLQPVAFVLEGVGQQFWGRFRWRWLAWVKPQVLKGFERMVGYVWVFTWLVWEAPRRNYALRYCKSDS